MRKVFIYGGCTSRDAVDHHEDYGLELHSYIARQSLISVYRPADAKLSDTAGIEGTFQRRMVRGDIASTLPTHLAEKATEIDLMVWDLMIERVGVQKVRSGGMITRNGVPRRAGPSPMCWEVRTPSAPMSIFASGSGRSTSSSTPSARSTCAAR